MKRLRFVMIVCVLSAAMVARADEIVFKGSLGLISYVKKNIRLMDTVTVGMTSYLRYSALDGTVQVPVTDVIEIRFIPYDLAEISVLRVISDTLAIPISRSATPLKSVTVSSVAALKSTLLDNTVDEIVVTNGRYAVSPASNQSATSLWIGQAYASRTRPVTVRAQTRGGVTFDGGGAEYFGGLTFVGGAHDQTWDGFNFTNGTPTYTGVIVLGAYVSGADANPAHHITLRYINIFGCRGVSTSASSPTNDHGIYISYAGGGGVHDIVFDNFSIDDRNRGGLSTGFHFYHSDPASGYYNAKMVTISNLTVRGTQQAVLLWDETLGNITVTDAVIKDALTYGVRYETTGSTGIVFRNITTTGSGSAGFYSSSGSSPAGVTFVNNSFK